IGDWSVTGVQTCALPISRGARRLFHSGRQYMSGYAARHFGLDVLTFWAGLERALADFLPDPAPASATLHADQVPTISLTPRPTRSEERRVGKECRSGRSA